MNIFKKNKSYTVVYLTPNTFIFTISLIMLFLLVFFIGYDYLSNKGSGGRFTYEDGVALHEYVSDGEITQSEIDSIYGNNSTDFKKYLEEEIN